MSDQGTAPKRHWWQRKVSIIAFVIGGLVLIALIFAIHVYHWDMTTTTITEVAQSSQQKVTTTEIGRSLLDWLQLLGVIVIPIVVGFGTAFFSRQQAKTSEANAESQRQEELLRTYFDKISDLLLDEKLGSNPNIQSIVRARTLDMLHMLNPERKATVLWFLHDSNLLQHVKSFLYSLDLSHSDLGGIDLNKADLNGTDLSEANLMGAKLSGADLSYAKLNGASLNDADLSEASLFAASLIRAFSPKANFSRANLIGANLSGAFLGGTNLTEAKLSGAILSGVVLPEANLSRADLSRAFLGGTNLAEADLNGANLSEAIATPELFTRARNVTSEQLAQIRAEPPTLQEIRTAQRPTTLSKSEIRLDQAGQEGGVHV